MNEERSIGFRERIKLYKRCIEFTENADKGYILRDVLGFNPLTITEFIDIYLSSQLIDRINSGQPIKELLLFTALVNLCVFGLYALVKFVKRREESHKFLLTSGMNRQLFGKLLTMDYRHIEDIGTQTRYSRAKQYSDNAYTGVRSIAENIKYLIDGILQTAAGLILVMPMILAPIQKQDGFIGFFCSMPGFIVVMAAVIPCMLFRSLYLNQKSWKIWENARKSDIELRAHRIYDSYIGYVINNYRSGKEIRLYNEQNLIANEMSKTTDIICSHWLKAFLSSQKIDFIYHILGAVQTSIIVGFAVIRAIGGMMTAGEVVALSLYFVKFSKGLSAVSDTIGDMRAASTFCTYVFDFLDTPNEQYKGTIPTEKRNDNEYEFEFRHVWFKYPNTEQYVLRDVNMKWRIGEKMALVGRNGCGKSTLVKLLCRLYDPTKGEITLNGIDIRKYDYDDYMALFSVVFQDSSLFAFSLAENVAASTEYDAEKVEDCVRRSGLAERLDTLPEGINTYLYKEFDEHGVEISGGEAQKLCLARAIYKGAPFIVLDEPTAALDPISEHDIYTKFNGIVGTRTAIYISHRLSSCRFCDEITVMDNGEIVERGSHDMLVSAGGHYAELWSAQAEYYRDTAGELFE